MNVDIFSYVINRSLVLEKDEGYAYHPSYKKSDIELSASAIRNLKANIALQQAYYKPKKKKEHQQDTQWEYGFKRLTAKPKYGQIAFDFGSSPSFHIRGIGIENPPGSEFKYTLNWIGPHEAYNKIIKQSR